MLRLLWITTNVDVPTAKYEPYEELTQGSKGLIHKISGDTKESQ